MHNGFLNVDGEKMSKSLGNFFTIRDVLKKYDGETLRFFMLRTHYRRPFNFSDTHLDDAQMALTRLYTSLDAVSPVDAPIDWADPHAAAFKAAMDAYGELNAKNENWKKIYADYSNFRRDQNLWFRFTEARYDSFMQNAKL